MSWLSRKIEREKYTRPPTGREVSWALLAAEGYREAAYRDHFCGNCSFSKIKYELPAYIDASDGSDDGLKKILDGLPVLLIREHIDLSELSDPNDREEKLRNYMRALSPQRILERGKGDCKSLAVLSVCYKRQAGVPVRFLNVKDGCHLIFEERDGKLWVPKDPDAIRRGIPLPHWFHPYESDPDYDYEYLNTISLI